MTGVPRTFITLTLACALSPALARAATDADFCKAAIEVATGKYTQCRLTAESRNEPPLSVPGLDGAVIVRIRHHLPSGSQDIICASGRKRRGHGRDGDKKHSERRVDPDSGWPRLRALRSHVVSEISFHAMARTQVRGLGSGQEG